MSSPGNFGLHLTTPGGTGGQHRVPSAPEARIMELEDEWGAQEQQEMTQDQQVESNDNGSWEPNPLPLMANHPPRITASNTKILLQEGILSQPCPTGEDDLGWIQLQQKSLTWATDRGLLCSDPRRAVNHGPLIQIRLDYFEWNLEPSPRDLGADPGHPGQDSGIVQLPNTPGGSERVYTHEAPSPCHQTVMGYQ